MKLIDRWAGLILCALLSPFGVLLPDSIDHKPKNILIVKFWGMGSMLMVNYLVVALKKALPESRVTLLTLSSNREIVNIIGAVDETITLDISRGLGGAISGIIEMLGKVRSAKYDCVLDLEYLTRFTALVTLISNAPIRAGFYARGFWRGNFHNRKVPFNTYWHVRDNFLNQATAAGIKFESPSHYVVDSGETGRGEVDKLLKELDVTKRFIIINPNAGETSLERRWPPERFSELARMLAEKQELAVLIVGAPNESALAKKVADMASTRNVISVAGKTTIRGLAALMAKSEAVVSNDSGPLHLAAHVGAKVVGIYGPETPVLWGPLCRNSAECKVFFRNLDCSPCINIHNMKTVHCLRDGADCLTGISVDEVFSAVVALLGKT